MQSTRSRGDTAAQDYERHRRAVMGMLAKRFPRFDENERLEIYHEAWTRVFAKRMRGEEIHSLRAYLQQTAAAEAMNAVTRGRPPVPISPDDPVVTTLAAEESTVEERVLVRDQARLARELIDSLDGRQRDLLKLRLDLQLSAGEIRAALGLSGRQYQRLAEEGAAAIASRVRDLEDGTWSRRQRSLLTACLIQVDDDDLRAGIATDEQRAEAQRLLDSDPHVAALYVEVRGAMRRAAAILPLPAIPLGDGLLSPWLIDRVTTLSDHARSLAESARQQVTGSYLRAADAATAFGSSGTLVATVAGSVVIASGAYVAAESLPVDRSTLEAPPAVGTTATRKPALTRITRADAPRSAAPKRVKSRFQQRRVVESPKALPEPSEPDSAALGAGVTSPEPSTPNSSSTREINEFDFEN